jgi:hypothetical protein
LGPKLATAAAAAGATVFMSNQAEFDAAAPRIKMIASRKPDEPHPFEIGKEAIGRYFMVGQECGEAAKLRFADAKQLPGGRGCRSARPLLELNGASKDPPGPRPTAINVWTTIRGHRQGSF